MMTKPSSQTGQHMMAGTVRIFFAEALILPTGFITAIFLARRLGPTNYGLFVLLSQLVLWIEWISVSAFTGTTVKFISEAPDWRPVGTVVVRLYLIVGCSVTALLWTLSVPIAHIFNEPSMVNYVRLFALEIPIFSLACANRNILVGMRRFKERARLGASRLTARLILVMLFVEMGLSINGAILGTIGASIVEWGISRYYIRPALFVKSVFPMRRLWGVAVPVFMSNLSLRLFKMDLFVLKALGGTAAQVGFYGVAENLSIPPSLVSQSVSLPLLSTLSHLLSQEDRVPAKEIGATAVRAILWLVPFTVMVAIMSYDIVGFIFGPPYSPAAPILSLLIFSALGLLTINVCKAILIAIDKPHWTFRLSGPMVPLALIGHLILIPRMGMLGAALVTMLVACLGGLASLAAVYQAWRIYPPMKTLLRSMFCSVLVLALARLWLTSNFMIVIKLLVIALVIPLIFYLLREFTSREMGWIRAMILRRTTT